MTKIVKNGRGRPALLGNKKKLAAFLKNGEFQDTTFFLKQKLVAAGFLGVTKVQTGKRGRPAEVLALTGKSRGLIALSANWK